MRGDGPDPLMKRYEERVVYLPLSVQGQNIGLLVVDNLLSQQTIYGEDIGLLRSFAGQIGLAVDNQRLFEEVQSLSLYDHLTGLAVRRYFNQRFQEELYRVERGGPPLSVVMIDVDHFKGINDTFGHQVGDLALKELGALIQKRLRKIDFPARFGGDEIVILLPQASAEDAANIMGRLLVDLRELRIPVPFSSAKEIGMTASIGVAAYPEDGRRAEDLLHRADEALYWVKTRGRDGVCTYQQALLERPSAADR
ncbi:MAG: sensor domain-containing diguanylate cyclase [Elusimicrobia bacterium]|nr:sensor domain-containing diguanylate cyclase [Elusimicrobiota bacterium]